MDAEKLSHMVSYSAVRPDERMSILNDSNSVINVLQQDPIAKSFGLDGISSSPLSVPAVLLPPAKLQFGRGKRLEPGLSGTWNFEGNTFAHAPPGAVNGQYKFAIMVVNAPRSHQPPEAAVNDFLKRIQEDCKSR